jgi:hypothetical protein
MLTDNTGITGTTGTTGITNNTNLEEKLKVYNILANNLRLHILYILYKEGEKSYEELLNELKPLTKKRTMNIAYHLSILKSSDFININYIRNGRNLSVYKLTNNALKHIAEEKLFDSIN